MIVLMTAALAAAQPASAPQDSAMSPAHLAMGEHANREQMNCCDCCKDMAGHEGREEHHRRRAH